MFGTSLYVFDTFLLAGDIMADKSDASVLTDKDPVFPGEDPTQPELDAWIKVMSDRLKKTEYFYLVSRETPPSLIGISEPIDLSMLREQDAPQR